jgi:hypothetical protein
MNTLRRGSKALAGLVGACLIVAAPSLVFADSDRHERKHRHANHRSYDRDDCDRGRERVRERRRDRDDDDRRSYRRGRSYYAPVRYARPNPYVALDLRVGAPARPRPAYAPVCQVPVVYVPVSQYGPYYYDEGCGKRFSTFDLYFAHVSDRHAASVRIRN